jgi:hypothetical protein
MQLLDRSSLGRDYNAFKALYTRIERALRFVVNGLLPPPTPQAPSEEFTSLRQAGD